MHLSDQDTRLQYLTVLFLSMLKAEVSFTDFFLFKATANTTKLAVTLKH